VFVNPQNLSLSKLMRSVSLGNLFQIIKMFIHLLMKWD